MADNQLIQLVQKACARDRDAFVSLCEMKAPYVLYFCRQVMRNPHDAEDAAQEVFVRMQKKIVQLHEPAAFNTWLNRLIISTCLNMRRKMTRDKGNVSLDDYAGNFISDTLESLPEEYIEDASLRESIVELVQNLPDKYQQCILLCYYQNMSYAEAAATLNITPDAVQHNLKMARKHLRVELDDKVDSWKQSGTPMMALSPALGAIFSQSAAATVLPTAAQQCLQAAGVYTAFATGGAAAGTITTFFTGPVLQGLISAALATGVALTVLFATASPPLPANVPVAGDPQRLPQTASGYEDTASILDAAIPDAPGPAQTISVPGTGTVSGGAGAVAGGSGTGGAGAVVSGKQTSVSETPTAPTIPVPAVPAQTASQTAKLKGSVVFKKADGTVISGGGKYAAGFDVTLKQEENVITRTKVDAAGTYAFDTLNIEDAGEYTILITPPSSRDTGFAAENPVGSLTVELTPSEAAMPVTAPVLYITDTTPPEVGLSLQNTAGEKCAVNPVKAVVSVADETGTTCRWQVLTADGSQVLYSGTGETVTTPFTKMRTAGQTGDHILKVTVTDAAGNVTETQQVFCIT